MYIYSMKLNPNSIRRLLKSGSPYLLGAITHTSVILGFNEIRFDFFPELILQKSITESLFRTMLLIFLLLGSVSALYWIGYQTASKLLQGKHSGEIYPQRLQFVFFLIYGVCTLKIFNLVMGEFGALIPQIIIPVFIVCETLGTVALFKKLSFKKINLKLKSELNKLSLILLFASIIFFIYIRRVVAIGGGGDYLTHYGPYYEAVMRSGQTHNTELWYHYWFSKASGLGQILVICSEPNGFFVASFINLIIIASLIYVWLEHFTKAKIVPISSGLFFLLITNYGISRIELSKHHVDTALLVISSFVLGTLLVEAFAKEELFKDKKFLLRSFSLITISLTAQQPAAFGYSILIFFLFWFFILINRKQIFLKFFLPAFLFQFFCLIFTLMLNYGRTGFFEAVPWRLWRNIANLEITNGLINPYLLATLDAGSGENFGKPSTLNLFNNIKDLIVYNPIFNLFIRIFPDKVLLFSFIILMLVLLLWYALCDDRKLRFLNLLVYPSLLFIFILVAAGVSGQNVSLARGSWYLFVFPLLLVSIFLADIEFRHKKIDSVRDYFVFFLCFVVWTGSAMRFAYDQSFLHYLQGKQSLNAYSANENKYLLNLSEAVLCAKKDGGVLALFWDNKIGPAHLVGSGVETSVSYSLGRFTYAKLAFGDQQESITAFDSLDFRYIVLPLNRSSQLDLSLGNSSFVSQTALKKYFSPVASIDGFLIVERRQSELKSVPLHKKCKGVIKTPKELLITDSWTKFQKIQNLQLKRSQKNQGFQLHNLLARKYYQYGEDIIEVPLTSSELGKGWQ
jgi:hypothetical protein